MTNQIVTIDDGQMQWCANWSDVKREMLRGGWIRNLDVWREPTKQNEDAYAVLCNRVTPLNEVFTSHLTLTLRPDMDNAWLLSQAF